MVKKAVSKMGRLGRNYNSLCTLGACKPEMRKAIIKNADEDLVYALCEIIFNMMNGSIKIDKGLLENIKSYKNCFRRLVASNGTVKQKKAILRQKGSGWMPFLIPPIIETVKHLLNL